MILGSGQGSHGSNKPDNSGQYVPTGGGQYTHVTGPEGSIGGPYQHVEGPSGKLY